MQLGFVSAILAELSLEEVLSTAANIGYDCVEVMCWPLGKAERRYAGVTHIDVDSLDDDQVAAIQDLCSQTAVEISGLGYYPNALTADANESEASIAHIRKVIAATAKLGLGRMNTFIGRDWTQSVDDNWPRFVEVWRPMIAFAEQQGVRVGIENCPMFFSDDEWPSGKNLAHSPAIWRRMFEEIPSDNFGLNYDPSHMIWQFMDAYSPIKAFSHKLFHMHAKDVRVDYERLHEVGILANPLQYHTPKLPGLGDVDWGRFFSMLTDTGYDGPVCVEVEDRAYEGSLEARLGSLQQSHDYLRPFVPKI